MEYWIKGSDGQTYGPADLARMEQWIAEHRVTTTTPVSRTNDGPWVDAGLTPTLLGAFGSFAAGRTPPYSPEPYAAAPQTPPTQPAGVPHAVPANWPPDMIAIPQLVSGIFNLLFAAGYLLTCIGIILAVPLAILGIYELISYSRARNTPPEQYLESAQTKAICSIVVVVVGNFGSMICGILILTQVSTERNRITVR